MNTLFVSKLRLYLDTTVPNYVFADHYLEKRGITRLLMSEIKALRHEAYISDVVLREILAAPESLLTKMMHEVKDLERLKSSMESERLASVYLQHKIFPAKSMDDARHVAIATISNMDAVVSWNFGHLVNIVKIKKVNTINEMMGYKHMEIVTPQEVVNAKD